MIGVVIELDVSQYYDPVDMLSRDFRDAIGEKIYDMRTERMQDRCDEFGSLPDNVGDEWIGNIELLHEKIGEYVYVRRRANGFDIRYDERIQPPEKGRRKITDVLPPRDVSDLMPKPWR